MKEVLYISKYIIMCTWCFD